VARITTTLAEYCGACHGAALTVQQAQAGINFISDLDALVERGLIVECAAEQSPLVQVLRSNHGFDPGVEIAPPAEELDLIVGWIDEGCTETRRLCAEQPSLEGCAKVHAERVLDRRCGMCHGRAQRERTSATGVNAFSFLEADDMVAMIESGLVIPCDSSGSPLVQRMRDGSMPPAGAGQLGLRPSDEARVTAFIDGLCSAPEAPELLAERTRLEDVLRSSCGSCHGQSAIDSGQLVGGAIPEDIVSLERDRWLIPCNSRGSPLLRRMRSGDMPPRFLTDPRPTPADMESLAAIVDWACVDPVP
jgi:mono/diheme cytochrome c family protein